MTDHGQRPPVLDPFAALQWSLRMADELRQLPEAIAQWREGVALFVGVARRLEAATSNAEQLLAQVEATGLVEQLQRMQALSVEFGRQAADGGATMGEQMVEETRRNIEAITRLFGASLPPPQDSR
jgi:hypothetical protein